MGVISAIECHSQELEKNHPVAEILGKAVVEPAC